MSSLTRPAPKPARSPRQMSTAERLRQISEQADALYLQLFNAIAQRDRFAARRAMNQLIDLGMRYDVVAAESQDQDWSQVA